MKIFKVLFVLFPLLVFSGTSNAQFQRPQQPQCNERDNVLELLAKKYQEIPIAAGVTNTGGLVEVLNDPKTGTWTIIVSTPQGMSCLVAAGEGWRWFKQEKLEEGDKIRYVP